MSSGKNAAAVDRIIVCGSLDQIPEKRVFLRLRVLVEDVPGGQGQVITAAVGIFYTHLTIACGRVNNHKAVFVSDTVPAGVFHVNGAVAGIAMAGKDQRNRDFGMLTDCLRHIYIPFAQPAIYLFHVIFHMTVAKRIVIHAQISAGVTHPAAVTAEKTVPDAVQHGVSGRFRTAGKCTRPDFICCNIVVLWMLQRCKTPIGNRVLCQLCAAI